MALRGMGLKPYEYLDRVEEIVTKENAIHK